MGLIQTFEGLKWKDLGPLINNSASQSAFGLKTATSTQLLPELPACQPILQISDLPTPIIKWAIVLWIS